MCVANEADSRLMVCEYWLWPLLWLCLLSRRLCIQSAIFPDIATWNPMSPRGFATVFHKTKLCKNISYYGLVNKVGNWKYSSSIRVTERGSNSVIWRHPKSASCLRTLLKFCRLMINTCESQFINLPEDARDSMKRNTSTCWPYISKTVFFCFWSLKFKKI